MDSTRLADRPVAETTFRQQLAGYLLGQLLHAPGTHPQENFEVLARRACALAEELIAALEARQSTGEAA